MHVRITNCSEATSDLIVVSILQLDEPRGEPASLAREHELQLGESVSLNLTQAAVVVLASPAPCSDTTKRR